jgi:hypothetical protein
MKLLGIRRRKRAQLNTQISGGITEDSLLMLCRNDQETYDAMGHFLLIEPEQEMNYVGTTQDLLQRSEEAIRRGDQTSARVNFEILARIEMYKGDAAKVRTLLKRAIALHDVLSETREIFLLSNLEKCMMIAKEYYHQAKDSELEAIPLVARVKN